MKQDQYFYDEARKAYVKSFKKTPEEDGLTYVTNWKSFLLFAGDEECANAFIKQQKLIRSNFITLPLMAICVYLPALICAILAQVIALYIVIPAAVIHLTILGLMGNYCRKLEKKFTNKICII
jgi:hypothetical protein